MSYMDLLLNGPPQPQGQPAPAPQPNAPQGQMSQSYMNLLMNGQSLSAPPANTRVPSENVIDDPRRGASVGGALVSGLPPDDAGKIKALSQSMGVPVERFGVMNGDIVYVGDDNKTYKAIPSVSGATGVGDFMRRGVTKAASELGPNVPGLVGAATGIATAPFAGGVPGAVAGAATADTLRQALANALIGRPVTDIDGMNVAGQAALAGGGQGASALLGRALSRNPMKIAPYDRAQALNPQTLADAQAAQAAARAQGTSLSFGQATGLPSALTAERQLARDPASMDTMGKFYDQKRGEFQAMVDRFTGGLSPVRSAEQGAGALREGASATIDKFVADRRAVAKPLYDSVMQTSVDPVNLARALGDSPMIPEILDRIKNSKIYAPELGGAPDNSLRLLDLAKRELDDMAKAAKAAGRNNEARLIEGQRDKFVSALDDATLDPNTGVSAYKQAREAFAARSPEIDALRNGPVGTLADRETPKTAKDLGTLFNFQNIGPDAVADYRKAFEKAGQTDKWEAGLATYLRDQLAGANGSPKVFLNRVFGNEANQRERDVLRAAMSPAQWGGFTAMMETVERVARTLPEGSQTATDLAGGQALRNQFGAAGRLIGRFTSPQRAIDVGGAVGDRVTNRLADEGMLKLAKAVTDPNNVEALKKLRMLPPGSQAAMSIVSQMIGGSVVTLFGGRTPDEMTPPVLSGQR